MPNMSTRQRKLTRLIQYNSMWIQHWVCCITKSAPALKFEKNIQANGRRKQNGNIKHIRQNKLCKQNKYDWNRTWESQQRRDGKNHPWATRGWLQIISVPSIPLLMQLHSLSYVCIHNGDYWSTRSEQKSLARLHNIITIPYANGICFWSVADAVPLCSSLFLCVNNIMKTKPSACKCLAHVHTLIQCRTSARSKWSMNKFSVRKVSAFNQIWCMLTKTQSQQNEKKTQWTQKMWQTFGKEKKSAKTAQHEKSLDLFARKLKQDYQFKSQQNNQQNF